MVRQGDSVDLHVEDCDSHRERTFPADDCDPPPVVCGKAQSSSRKYVPDRVGPGFRSSVRVNYESDGVFVSEVNGDFEKSLIGRYFLATFVSRMRQKYGVLGGLNDC